MSRESIIKNSKVMIGRNNYSWDLRTYALSPYTDGKYYSDCSSFASACFIAGGHTVAWNNTNSFCTDDDFYTVPIVQIGKEIQNAASVLKVADVIIWSGHCCIVERIENGIVYVMDHGSGNPRILKLSDVCSWNSGDIVVRRLKELDNEDTDSDIIEDDLTEISSLLYKVQAGAFNNKEAAEDLCEELNKKGFESFVSLKDGKYCVQCGAFKDQLYASKLADKLRNANFDAYVYQD